jgi:transcriptional regulator with XRE-family HTH domain
MATRDWSRIPPEFHAQYRRLDELQAEIVELREGTDVLLGRKPPRPDLTVLPGGALGDYGNRLQPARIFGLRVREIREARGQKQGELARDLSIDRTTLNKIERGTRSDVSLSLLFAFANVLGVNPVHLLTPRANDVDVEITPGGRVMSAPAARRWIRGMAPPEGVDVLDWFVGLRPTSREIVEAMMPAENRFALMLTEGGLEQAVRDRLEAIHAEAQTTAASSPTKPSKDENDGG